MARMKIHIDRLEQNIERISELMREHKKEWSLVVKALGTDRIVLERILNSPSVHMAHSIAVSQWKSLQLVKNINPSLRTLFIKPPAIANASKIVKYADISLNSSIATIQALSKEAVKQNKTHQIFVMIEMGELREGIKREGLIPFYKRVFKLPNIDVIGIGTNLGCMYGIKPTYDKLIQLVLYKQLIEANFKRNLEFISGASSITIPMLEKGVVPQGINHFRIGEAVFLGTSPLNNKQILDMNTGAFTFEANIVELYKKGSQPDGIVTNGAIGNVVEDESLDGLEKFRAILDFGELDVDHSALIPEDSSIRFIGNTSDLSVYDLGDNTQHYKTGDVIRFHLKYMAVAKIMYSRFVDKVIV
jgi:predicted amino acid racemase